MSNMAHCRFHNTRLDLADCIENWDEPKSTEEEKEKKRLLKLCREVVNDFGDDDD